MLENVALQWVVRRVPEFAGIIVTLVTFYNSVPPQYQDIIIKVLSGQGGGLTVSALIGFALWVYAQVVSYKSTVRSKEVVKVDGAAVEISAPRKSLWDVLKGK